RLNIRHPRQGNFPSPISTDFVITRRDGIYARTVKESRELEDPRVLEKFSIEFQYWKEKGIDWKIVTEKEINRDLARNLQWLHSGPSVTEIIPDAGLREEACALLLELFAERQFSFSGMLEIAEEGLGLPPGAAITLFKNLVLTGRVSLDLNQPMDFMDPFAKED
ncbi:MAG: heteromeric transposase endonuclease subunit TnsA, partial [Clostridia bacterium]|nr:heteromeric transposase endonuclease subunit TnsA [Clostridia bacterium]